MSIHSRPEQMLEAQLTRPHTLCPCDVVVVVLQTSRLGSVVGVKLDVGTGVEVHQSLGAWVQTHRCHHVIMNMGVAYLECVF